VHLHSVRNDRNGMGFGQRYDLARVSDTADAVGVELNVIQSFIFDGTTSAGSNEIRLLPTLPPFVLTSCSC
jgi:hypothetical protein